VVSDDLLLIRCTNLIYIVLICASEY